MNIGISVPHTDGATEDPRFRWIMTTNTDSIPVVPTLNLSRLFPAVKTKPTESVPHHADVERERRERDWLRQARLLQGFMIR